MIASRLTSAARTWWPVVAILATSIAIQTIWTGRYDDRIAAMTLERDHAAGHLEMATVIFLGSALLAVILWAIPAGRRRDALLWVCGALLIAGHLIFMRGNVQVVDALGVGGPAGPGHDLYGRGAWLAVLASMLLAIVLVRRHLVGRRAGAGAIVVSLVVPYFIFPGAGVAVLAVSRCVAKARAERATPGSRHPQPSGSVSG